MATAELSTYSSLIRTKWEAFSNDFMGGQQNSKFRHVERLEIDIHLDSDLTDEFFLNILESIMCEW